MSEFNFKVKTEEVKWLVDRLIPLGHLCFILAQAGKGKSLFLNSLLAAVINGAPYAELKTMEGDVLIIDQDTPTEVLKSRLLKWNNAFSSRPKHKLYWESMKGYNLSDGTLMSIIKDHSSCVLTIIDCLGTVCGRLNPNYTSDMMALSKLKSQCLNGQNTILINHHISQKEEYDIPALMTNDPGRFAMGASTIVQQADSYYILGAEAHEGKTTRMYIRPVSKRVSIPTRPLILRLLSTDTNERIVPDGYFEEGIDEVEGHVLLLFQEHNIDRTVKDVYDHTGHRHGETAIRKALSSLDAKGKLVMSKSKHNLFRYRLLDENK